MTYTQTTLEEGYAISALRKLGYSCAAIARELGRAPSSIGRVVRRNARITADEWAFVEHRIR